MLDVKDDIEILEYFESLIENNSIVDKSGDVIELVLPVVEYDHKEFIVNEVRRSRMLAMENPTPGNLIALLVWLDTLIHELDKDAAEDSIKIAA